MGLEELLLEWAEKKGIEEGKEFGKEQEVQHLIIKLGLNNKKTAEVAEVSLEFVEKIRKKLG